MFRYKRRVEVHFPQHWPDLSDATQMAPILRVKARWSGFQGSPGYSIFHFKDFAAETYVQTDATAVVNKTRAFFLAVAGLLPAVVSVDVQTDVELIDHDSGDLIDVLNANPVATVTGGASGTAPYAAASGAVVSWRTTQVRNGRRIRGRTFLVPLSSAAFESNGTLTSGALTSLGIAGQGMITPGDGPDFGVYARPPAGGVGAGEFAQAMGFTAPDIGAVLRSRRD